MEQMLWGEKALRFLVNSNVQLFVYKQMHENFLSDISLR
jgi:hypothetical protein